jgi:methylmalonyl-CoA mutase N-terminal domain/subunit
MKRKDFSKLKVEVQKEKDSYFEHEDYIAGAPPYLRGIYATMYLQEPLKKGTAQDIPLQENMTPEIEISNFLSKSYHLIQNNLQENIPIDTIISKLSFHTTINKNHFDEIAKMRAVRILWAGMIKLFSPKKQESFALNIYASIHNSTETLTAIMGGCQSITSKDKSHLFFEEETNILKTVDPWAGSFYIEKRTEDISNTAWQLFKKETNL